MKEVILSADGNSMVYLVPDAVADDLRKYCLYFANKWIWQSPDAARYRKKDEDGLRFAAFGEEDFIDYLNEYAFPEQRSVLVKDLGWTNLEKELPEEYRNHPYFNF